MHRGVGVKATWLVLAAEEVEWLERQSYCKVRAWLGRPRGSRGLGLAGCICDIPGHPYY